ncbi:unnamed protein product [Gongylonema pulchrum]|uniref:Uncharacterized protein n=1 Tax=Gongylonema pulchrum TaxID=637853 RepID=A0A183D732_9BILA|nr:unnamed protein product [Gongylonema pulchrum]
MQPQPSPIPFSIEQYQQAMRIPKNTEEQESDTKNTLDKNKQHGGDVKQSRTGNTSKRLKAWRYLILRDRELKMMQEPDKRNSEETESQRATELHLLEERSYDSPGILTTTDKLMKHIAIMASEHFLARKMSDFFSPQQQSTPIRAARATPKGLQKLSAVSGNMEHMSKSEIKKKFARAMKESLQYVVSDIRDEWHTEITPEKYTRGSVFIAKLY